MAAPVVNGSISTSGAGVTTLETATITPGGSNRALLVGIGCTDSVPAQASAVKFGSTAGTGGASLTKIAELTAQSYVRVELWRLIAPANSAGTVWAQWGASAFSGFIGAMALADVDQTTPFGTPATANGNGTGAGTVNVTSATGKLVIDFMYRLAGLQSVGAGQTQAIQVNGIGGEASGCMSSEAGATTTTMSWTDLGFGSVSNWEWVMAGVSVNEVGGGGGGGGSPLIFPRRMSGGMYDMSRGM